MKRFFSFLFHLSVASILIGCQIAPSFTPTHDFNSEQTPVVAPTSLHLLATPTLAPLPTKSALQILSRISANCERFGETVYSEFIQTYGDKGCKLPVLSPDGKYLAYVTLSRQNTTQGVYFTDTVKVITLEKNNPEKEMHTSLKKNYISQLEWGPNGELMIWEAVWEGSWALFIYNTFTSMLLAKMKTDQLTLQWNIQHTAFYVVHTGDYGKDTCVSELGGFDFQTNSTFPDLYGIFNIERREEDLFGIPYSTSDNLRVDPFSWSLDGKKLWLAITPLEWKGNEVYEYQIKPIQAGVLQLSKTGMTYTSLAADANSSYLFQGQSDPKIISKPYLPKVCP